MRFGLVCLATAMAAIAGVWAWLGAPVADAARAARAGRKALLRLLRAVPRLAEPARPLDADFRRTDRAGPRRSSPRSPTACAPIRSISGCEQIPEIAAAARPEGDAGALAVERRRAKPPVRSRPAVALANRYPDTVRAVVVGNEVLLRGEMSPGDLAATIRAVKARVKVPVTYADVWEFWLRNRDARGGGRFRHHPYPAVLGGRPGRRRRRRRPCRRDPRAGGRRLSRQGDRDRRGRLAERRPHARRARCRRRPTRRASSRTCWRVAERENFRVNVIEAFDQPWKRALEGTVGGHWGLFDDANRRLKFAWGEPVSDHPYWRWQAAGGIVFALRHFRRGLCRTSGRAAFDLVAGGDGQRPCRRHPDRLGGRERGAGKPRRWPAGCARSLMSRWRSPVRRWRAWRSCAASRRRACRGCWGRSPSACAIRWRSPWARS